MLGLPIWGFFLAKTLLGGGGQVNPLDRVCSLPWVCPSTESAAHRDGSSMEKSLSLGKTEKPWGEATQAFEKDE